MEKVRWGVLSTAKIGIKQVIPAMQKSNHCEVVAIASRNTEKAEAASRQLGIVKAYGTYEELLADPLIDAVYIPLPNHLHVEWTLRAMDAGKHVLCEKPIGMDTGEAEKLLRFTKEKPELKVMEAFMYRFHPQWRRARDLVVQGEIGELQAIQSFFSYYNVDSENIRNNSDTGGGGLMDIGCYSVSLSRFLFSAEPERVLGTMQFDENFQTDCLASAILDFDGRTSVFTCSTQSTPYQRVNIVGTEGRIEIEIPFNAPPDKPCRIWHHRKGQSDELLFEICDQYTLQADELSLAIINDTEVPTPLADAVANMRVIESLFQSAEKGCWIEQLVRAHP